MSSPQGERPRLAYRDLLGQRISIHTPHGGMTAPDIPCHEPRCTDFNPRSPRGERQPAETTDVGSEGISIHAPHGGATSNVVLAVSSNSIFQSTLPAGGATLRGCCGKSSTADFNPRSPRGSDDGLVAVAVHVKISIHAPHGGATRPLCAAGSTATQAFQSTLPTGGDGRAACGDPLGQ